MVYDVVVVGGGLAGAALARALRGSAVALVSKTRPTAPEAAFDTRIYAISPGNARFLTGLQAWQRLAAERITAVHAMRVHGDDGRSLLEFDSLRAGVSELAWIVEDGCLQNAIWQCLQAQERLELFDAASFDHLEVGADLARVFLSDGRILESQLVVGADGARSRVREQAGLASTASAYGQTAVVANFSCELPHRQVAMQWFRGGPVLALLPLPGNHVSMVWSTGDADAERLRALSPGDLAAEVEAASGQALGALSLVTPPREFQLQRLLAERSTGPRVALIGDAAHVVHPLAGQGANLGFHDARELARVLAMREPGRDCGDARLLRRYERARAQDILAMRVVVDGLFRLFGARGAAPAWLRNTGMTVVDRVSALKNLLMRQAMN